MQAGEQISEPATWAADIEAPEADVAEQHRELTDPGLDPEAVAGATGTRAGETIEADEADLADQAREAGFDEDDER
jgi:hypothetical protein